MCFSDREATRRLLTQYSLALIERNSTLAIVMDMQPCVRCPRIINIVSGLGALDKRTDVVWCRVILSISYRGIHIGIVGRLLAMSMELMWTKPRSEKVIEVQEGKGDKLTLYSRAGGVCLLYKHQMRRRAEMSSALVYQIWLTIVSVNGCWLRAEVMTFFNHDSTGSVNLKAQEIVIEGDEVENRRTFPT